MACVASQLAFIGQAERQIAQLIENQVDTVSRVAFWH